jgi:hypothetical protein
MNLVTFFFAEQNFSPGDKVMRRLIDDYEPGGLYDTDGEIRLNIGEFVDFVDRVNSTLIAPAYEAEIVARGISVSPRPAK